MLITKTASCDALYNWASKNGYVIPYTQTPRLGDLALFDFAGNHSRNQHVGVCESWSGSSGAFIEGNTSVTSNDNGGAVMRRTRTRTQIKCFIRPPYTKTQTAAKLLAIAAAELGATEYPAESNTVKYNTWFYGTKVYDGLWGTVFPWCMVFICWCFAALAGEISAVTIQAAKEGKTVKVDMPVLKKGCGGAAVKHLQMLMKELGYYGGKIDGDFGALTDEAVRAYQKAVGFTGDDVDGIIGAMTWGKLWAA